MALPSGAGVHHDNMLATSMLVLVLVLAVAAGTLADGTAPEQPSHTVKVCSVLSYGHGCVGDGVANCTAAL